MNDFINRANSRPANSLDGFSRQPKRRAVNMPHQGSSGSGFAANSSNKAKDGAFKAVRPGHLDDFRRPEGLASSNQVRRSLGAASAHPSTVAQPRPFQKPIIIDKKANKKGRRKYWLFGKRINKAAKKPWSKKRKIITVIVTILVLLMGIFGFLVYKNIIKVFKGGGGAAALDANVDPSRLRGEGDGRVNILLLGRGGEGHEGADLTDTIIVASVDPIAKEAALLSVPRDLYVPVQGSGSMKINSVFATGKNNYLAKQSRKDGDVKKQAEEAGFSLLEKTIESNLGLPMHYHSIVDFSGFKQAVDTVGGVEINVPSAVVEQMRIDGKPYKLDVKPGQQHMDGFKALAYSRSRYTSPRGDFDRSERQRLVILALKQKAISAGTLSNPAKVSGLLNTLGDHVLTNFSLQDISRLHELGKEIDSSKISSIGLADPPNDYITTSSVGGLSVVIPKAGVGDFSQIKSYLRNTLKDSFLKNENASIAVYNGTNKAGLATTKADELKSFGYNVTNVGNAQNKPYAKTLIVDLRGGDKKYTKNYLEKRFGVSTVGSFNDPGVNPENADFVIILGTDQAQ